MRATAYASCFAPRRLGHVNLWVDDLARSEAFYHEVGGLMVEFTEPDLQATFLGTGATQHDLGMIRTTRGVDRYGRDGLLQLPGTVGRHAGLNHLAWEVENEAELVEGFHRLQREGVAIDMTVDHQIAHSVYLFDPDGNYNEFYCDTVTDWRSVLHGEMGLISGHWDPLAAEGSTDARYPVNPPLRINGSAPLAPRRLTHAVLQTARMAEMKRFYMEVAGLHVAMQHPGVCYLSASMDDYAFCLVLIDGEAPGYLHASFELKDDDLTASLQALANRGVEVTERVELPWKRSIFLRDPDGMASEWYVPSDAVRAPVAGLCSRLARAA